MKLGFEVAQSTVAKYMVRRRGPPSQTWRTFLSNHAPDIAAIDLFVVPTISFGLLYGVVFIRIARRNLVLVSVTAHPTAEWVARQLTEAFPWQEAPRHLIRDRDAVYGAVFLKRLSAMGIRDHPTAPRSPWQNAYAERLIGSVVEKGLSDASPCSGDWSDLVIVRPRRPPSRLLADVIFGTHKGAAFTQTMQRRLLR